MDTINFLCFFQSKHIIFDFWFNQITKDSPCHFELGMSDTDSLLFKVTKPHEFWKKMDEHMDYSNYDPSHPKFSLENKARLGKFKNDLGSEKYVLDLWGWEPNVTA